MGIVWIGGKLTFIASCKTEGRDGPDDAKDLMRKQCYDLALCRVRAQERQTGARGCYDLLLLCARELTEDGLGDRGGRLDGQGVEKHVRCGRHV